MKEVPFSFDTHIQFQATLSGGSGTRTLKIFYDHQCNGKDIKSWTKSGSGSLTAKTGNLDNIFYSQNGCVYAKVTSNKASCSKYTLGFKVD